VPKRQDHADRVKRFWRRPDSTHVTQVWGVLASFWMASPKLLLNLLSAVAVVAICLLLIQSLWLRTIVVDPISVPRAMAEGGYTPEVAAQRFRDALNKFTNDAHTEMGTPNISLHGDLPTIVVPSVGLSLDTLAASLRVFFRKADRKNISGEFIIADKKLWLRLRLDGREVYSSRSGMDLENPDELFAQAAPAIFEVTQPYLVATWLYNTDKPKAMEKAKNIIARFPEADENVVWSHILLSLIYHDQEEDDKARDAAESAVRLNPSNSSAHTNLALALHSLGNLSAADKEYRTAIDLQPTNAVAHNNLGNLHYGRREIDEAIAEYRLSIKIDPNYASPHNGLGNVLSDRGKLDEAEAEYRLAIKIDSNYMYSHNGLGNVLKGQGKLDQAIAEFREALRINPNYELTGRNLNEALALKKKR
jgi:Tfp pilus assembly protein PilF